jgi:aminoglycoside/choline kinase family phosphotransferase
MGGVDWQEWSHRAALALDAGPEAAGRLGIRLLAADASNRTYFRAPDPGEPGRTVVLMRLADDPLKSDEVVDGERPARMPFLEMADYLGRGGVPVPGVRHEALADRLVVLEDLGDVTLERALAAGNDKDRLYRKAIDLMAGMHAHAERHPDPGCIAFKRRFGEGLLRWELEHFYEWALLAWAGAAPTPGEREVLTGFFDAVVGRLVALPQGFVHRDFQSRNLMVQGDRLRLIDFQDALQGPYLYDLVALLRDSYVAFTPAEVRALIAHFVAARRAVGLAVADEAEVARQFHLQALQRKLKDSGRFVYIDRVKKNPKFLPNIPRSLAYVREGFEAWPEFAKAREVIARYLPAVG